MPPYSHRDTDCVRRKSRQHLTACITFNLHAPTGQVVRRHFVVVDLWHNSNFVPSQATINALKDWRVVFRSWAHV